MNKMNLVLLAFVCTLLFFSCGKDEIEPDRPLTDLELILAIQSDADKVVVDPTELSPDATTILNNEFKNSYIQFINSAANLGFEVFLDQWNGVARGENTIVYFNEEGRELDRERERGGVRGNDQADCLDLVFPVTFVLPDESELSGDADVLRSGLGTWYQGHPDTDEDPVLSYPLEVIFDDSSMGRVVNDHQLATAYEDCQASSSNFDCPNLEANIGDSCRTAQGLVGLVNQDCECEVINTSYDCPGIQANIGDECINAICEAPQLAFVNANCECECQSVDFDCDNLQANIGDSCRTAQGMVGLVNQDCECEIGGSGEFDCPDIQANIGDVCRTSTGETGFVNQDCECEVINNTFDCPDLQANIGDSCNSASGVVGVVNQDCECEINGGGQFDCPDIQANIGDVCRTSTGETGFVNQDCECEVINNTFDCPDIQANIGDVCRNPAGEVGVINEDCECEI